MTLKKVILNYLRKMLKFIIRGKSYEVSKELLKQEIKTSQNAELDRKDKIELPSWVQIQQFESIFGYLNLLSQMQQQQPHQRQQRAIDFVRRSFRGFGQNHTRKIIQIMRISDYLTLQKFQHLLIHQCIIQNLQKENCIIYLEETHKKLKNSSSGSGASQAWYSLLNSCIDFISINLTEVYLKQPQRIEKLHQKILSQILDRKIKYQFVNFAKPSEDKKDFNENYQDKEIIFNLLMKSKKVNSVDSLCNCLKSNLLNKKINKKMHAKLSWKLQDLQNINDKKVKNFKFLDLNWVLQAIRTLQGNLNIKLTLLRTQQDIKISNKDYHIGVFYSKLYWTIDGSSTCTSTPKYESQMLNIERSGEENMRINYISFKNPLTIDIFQISKQFESKLENRKLQLSIYCSIDQCYSFVMNYIVNNYNQVRLDQKKLQKDEIYALIEGFKSSAKYSQAVWLIKYLAKSQLQIPLNLLQNLPFQKLPTYETQFLKKLVRNDNVILDEVFGKKQQNMKAIQIQNEINSMSTSKVSDNLETKSNYSRAPSRGRHRKIFGQSPQKSTQPTKVKQNNSFINRNAPLQPQNTFDRVQNQLDRIKQEQMRQIMEIIDLKNYFYDRNSPFLASF